MKKLFTILAVVATMVSCAKEDVVSVQEPAQIAFEGVFVENATRANDPSTTTNNIENFSVLVNEAITITLCCSLLSIFGFAQ